MESLGSFQSLLTFSKSFELMWIVRLRLFSLVYIGGDFDIIVALDKKILQTLQDNRLLNTLKHFIF